ncbi:Retinol dehydrogenase 12 [Aphanomyces cochlioides]|nr:Retinol dehydrogenase 12 [Aphanomyces cochlioides]
MAFWEPPVNQTGRVAIVTGGTAGLGLESVIQLSRKGAHFIFTARSTSRGQETLEKIKAALAPAPCKVEFAVAENADLTSVDAFASEFLARNLPLHILLLNAGVSMKPYRVIEGVESTLFIDQVAHQLLAIHILPLLERSAPSRVVILTSTCHAYGNPPDEELPSEANYDSGIAYCTSKLANVLLAHGLLKRTDPSKVFINSVHPGNVASDIFKTGIHFSQLPWLIRPVVESIFRFLFSTFASSTQQGALTQLYVATNPDIVENAWQGQYFTPVAKLDESAPLTRDPELIEKSWKWTNDVIARVLGQQH